MKKLSVANGTYINRDGVQKTNWVQVGVIGVSQGGKEYMLIDPTINFAGFPREEGKDMVMVGMFEEAQGQGGQPQHNNQGGYGHGVPPPNQGGYSPPPHNNNQPPPHNQPPIQYFDKDGNPLPQRG